MKVNNIILFILSIFALASCSETDQRDTINFEGNDPVLLQNSVKKLTDVIVYDIFSPPVASRIYAYTSLAAYEAIRFQDANQFPSIVTNLQGFQEIPQPDKQFTYSFPLAGIKAYMTVAQKITFSVDTLKKFENEIFEKYASTMDEEVFNRSIAFGEEIGKTILKRAASDNYKETRGFARYSIQKGDDKWKPTAPDYADASEPYWHKIKPLALDSAQQCKALPAVPYDTSEKSRFYQEVFKVYEIGNNLTKEQQEIASFWDDNPFVSHHKGHSMYASKKMTPGGHWIAVTTLASKQANKSMVETAEAYALTATALFDGFISCWEEKYRSQVVRPITYINDQIDDNWEPFLQTPPFPEYSSGHGVISASAATVLTNLFGSNFNYMDTTELEYGMGKRSFSSFAEAAKEAAYSRMYGGIHYEFTCEESSKQGVNVGNYVLLRTGKISENDEKVVLTTDKVY